jgi:hypothetical protein
MAVARKSSRYGHRDATMILYDPDRLSPRLAGLCDLQSSSTAGTVHSIKTGLMLRNKEHHSKISSARPGQWQRNCNAERAGGLHVDVQLDLGYLLDRQVGRFFALEYASCVDACLTMRLQKTACVTHQATGDSEVARLVDRGNRVADS